MVNTRRETLAEVIAGLERAGYRPRGHGREYRLACFVHGGTNPTTLTIQETPDGWAAKCWKPCYEGKPLYDAIRAAAGIDTERDSRRFSAPGRPGDRPAPKNGGSARPGAVLGRNSGDTRRPDTANVARRMWRESAPIPADPEHPARRWLAARRLWRPEFPLPAALRWLPAEQHYPGPHTGAGSLIALAAPPFAWAAAWPNPPQAQAVQLVAVDLDGNPALDRPPDKNGLGKRTLGPSAGAVMLLGCPVLEDAAASIRVAEGLADGLALAARYEGPAVATLGTSGASSGDLARWLAAWPAGAVIHADADEGGQRAAAALRRAVQDAGGNCRAVLPPEGAKDAGAVAADFSPIPDTWADYAATLKAMHPDWPRWEIARQSVAVYSDAEQGGTQ